MWEGIVSLAGNVGSGIFGIFTGKIDTQNAADYNAWQQGQSDLRTKQTRDAVAAAVAAAVAIALAVFIVKATGK